MSFRQRAIKIMRLHPTMIYTPSILAKYTDLQIANEAIECASLIGMNLIFANWHEDSIKFKKAMQEMTDRIKAPGDNK